MELPVVPLSVTSRAMVYVINSGFTDMEVSYRLPQHCPVDLAVAFPEGQNVRAMLNATVSFLVGLLAHLEAQRIAYT